jgi:hypothetical protein
MPTTGDVYGIPNPAQGSVSLAQDWGQWLPAGSDATQPTNHTRTRRLRS